jgi:hypothetical protein
MFGKVLYFKCLSNLNILASLNFMSELPHNVCQFDENIYEGARSSLENKTGAGLFLLLNLSNESVNLFVYCECGNDACG